jgi:RNA-directed DNA polymerase
MVARPNHPTENVRELQRWLYIAAKCHQERRFHALYDRIVRSHIKGKPYLYRWPSPKAMKAIRTRIRDYTQHDEWAGLSDIRDVIGLLNPVLRGWGGYFRTGNASGKFNQVDAYVRERLLGLLASRGGQRRWRPGGRPFNPRDWPHRRLVEEHGLYQLLGTIRYPGGTHAV